jgi:hypothetical protein
MTMMTRMQRKKIQDRPLLQSPQVRAQEEMQDLGSSETIRLLEQASGADDAAFRRPLPPNPTGTKSNRKRPKPDDDPEYMAPRMTLVGQRKSPGPPKPTLKHKPRPISVSDWAKTQQLTLHLHSEKDEQWCEENNLCTCCYRFRVDTQAEYDTDLCAWCLNWWRRRVFFEQCRMEQFLIRWEHTAAERAEARQTVERMNEMQTALQSLFNPPTRPTTPQGGSGSPSV